MLQQLSLVSADAKKLPAAAIVFCLRNSGVIAWRPESKSEPGHLLLASLHKPAVRLLFRLMSRDFPCLEKGPTSTVRLRIV